MVMLLLSLSACKQSGGNVRRVLVIESFNPAYKGYADIQKKISGQFQKEGIRAELHLHYLDCDQYLEAEEEAIMNRILNSEAKWKPELILVFDDQATYSLMHCGNPLAHQLPVIFAGVNFPNWPLLKQFPNVKGFWDHPEYMKTFQFIDEVIGPSHIQLWTNKTFLGRKASYQALKELKDHGINTLRYDSFQLLPNEKFVILTDSSQNKRQRWDLFHELWRIQPKKSDYNFYIVEEESQLLWDITYRTPYKVFVQIMRSFISVKLGAKTNGPTFTAVNEGIALGEGFIGGYITLPATERRLAVGAATKVLNGAPIASIGISKTPKTKVVDWVELQRWNISKKQLPADCQIINIPGYIRYKVLIIGASVLLVLLIIGIILYERLLFGREKKEKQSAQVKLKEENLFHSMAIAGGKIFAFQLKDYHYSFDSEFYKTNGLPDQPIPLEQFKSYIHPEDRQQLKEIIDKCKNSPLPFQNMLLQRRLNFNGKGYEWWEFRYLFNKKEDLISGICLNIDDTKRNEQLLIDAKRKAEESDHMKSTFVANMSHEIRTPLNAIVGFSNLITEQHKDLTDKEMQQYSTLINSNCDLLLKLINDILDLTRMESGKMKFSYAPCDLNELFQRIYRTERQLVPESLELRLSLPEKSCILNTDYLRLTQVITNIINNSSKFTDSGYIAFGYEPDGDKGVRITVEDTGRGIPKEQQQAIFERFRKLDAFVQGAGLGLSICQGIVQVMNGDIKLSSEMGKGTRFIITIPNHEATEESDDKETT
jgi:signal transduction histidine kinase